MDPTRIKTNNISEIGDVLGIEAARNAIINEATDTLREQGLSVDVRHIMLVADIMTVDGELKQIGRHGVSARRPVCWPELPSRSPSIISWMRPFAGM